MPAPYPRPIQSDSLWAEPGGSNCAARIENNTFGYKKDIDVYLLGRPVDKVIWEIFSFMSLASIMQIRISP